MENSRGKSKSRWNSRGGTLKIEGKAQICMGSQCKKNGKFQGGLSKFDWKSRCSTSKKSISSTEGWGYNFFSEKGHFFNYFFCFFRELFTDDFGDISMMVQKFITQVNTIILYNTTLVDPDSGELSKSF